VGAALDLDVGHRRFTADRVRLAELRQRAIEDGRDVTAGDGVPQETCATFSLSRAAALAMKRIAYRSTGAAGMRDGVRSGTFLTDDEVSAFGKWRAISSSTSRLLRRDAAVSSSRWFSAVR
jgi:hypothetical protein